MTYKVLLFILLTIYAFANLEGKRVYGENSIDKKVEKSQRYNENPLGKKQIKKKILTESKKNLGDLKKEMKTDKIKKTQSGVKNRVNKIIEYEKKKKGYKRR